MAKTVATIEKSLARMLGAGGTDPVSELADGDAETLRELVQEVLTGCYLPSDGHRPKWAERLLSLTFRAPLQATITLTNGSVDIVGASSSAIAGERILVDEAFYTYAGADKLLSAWHGVTGEYAVTFYQVAKPIPDDVTGVEDTPQCPQHGPLYPIAGYEQEAMLRGFANNDFWLLHSAYSQVSNRRNSRSNPRGYDLGDPWYYYIDSAAVMPDQYPTPIDASGTLETEESESMEIDGATYSGPLPAFYPSQRFTIYPFPDHALTVEFRGTINPRIADETTMIHLPADVIDAVFMPLCREAVAMNFPDYRGDNAKFLIARADTARARLRKLARPQRRAGGRISVKRGW